MMKNRKFQKMYFKDKNIKMIQKNREEVFVK